MKTCYDFIIIGAGPAGLAAALTAAEYNLSTIVINEQVNPGGQGYREIERADSEKIKILGSDYQKGLHLIRRFRAARVDYLAEAAVWQIEPDLTVDLILDGKAIRIRGKRILIATGAIERPVPIPGWTLPGVMAATAADVLLKSHGIVPSGRTALAGSGPLLLLTAERLIESGVSVVAVLDTTPPTNLISAGLWLPKALKARDDLIKGLSMIRRIHRSGSPIYCNVTNLKAVGSDLIESVRFFCNGRAHQIDVDTLFLHNGLVPDTQITRQIECRHQWNTLMRYWQPVVDKWGNSSVNGIGIAGDAKGIYGAEAAVASGRLAALEAAFRLHVICKKERNIKAIQHIQSWKRETAVRPFLDRLFRPDRNLMIPRDDQTIVCRCESVTAGQIRKALELGARGPNQIKSQTRSGMGPCQGRMCDLTVSEIAADFFKTDVSEIGAMRIRPPIKPITVKQLSEMRIID